MPDLVEVFENLNYNHLPLEVDRVQEAIPEIQHYDLDFSQQEVKTLLEEFRDFQESLRIKV